MIAVLCTVFFLSGASALLFETLWFRQTGLAFGNSVWATSLVLSSFMAGLALGNGLAARYGQRIANPVRAYAALEIVIGLAGLGLIALLPLLPGVLAPGLRTLLDHPALQNALRFSIAFALLLAPSVAMGTTLPLLVEALSARQAGFARVLGILYGANTLGAVAGALAGDFFLIARLGVLGSGCFAAALNAVAALVAWWVSRRLGGRAVADTRGDATSATRQPLSARARWLLAASLLSGAILLALEVVWFRILVLFVAGTSPSFSLMLAVVLAGIGLGGICASQLARLRGKAWRRPWIWSLLAGSLAILTYTLFGGALARHGSGFSIAARDTLPLAVTLMLPVSFVSGALFTLLGEALSREVGSPVRTAGLLTLANTLGAAAGPMLAGFLLLPLLGMERSLFALSAGYGLVAIAAAARAQDHARPALRWLAVGAFALAVLAFPFGRMDASYLALIHDRYERQGETIVALREGVTETIHYSRYDFLGEPLAHRLITNGYSMSGTTLAGKRYMTLFVHLPAALHGEIRDALLISYGVGTTAKALTNTGSIEHIDVVDISREVLEMNEIVYPDPSEHPLLDPRVRVHVEDGRHFLQTTSKRYDLITGEPPPPKYANVVYLYTQEYFRLAYERLNEGGIMSYWLPVYQLAPDDFRAIVAAFCGVFEGCSLWNGNGYEWILLGSRGPLGPVAPDVFSRPWRDPAVAEELAEIGVERPEQLGPLFLGDADLLREQAANTPPLTDNFPLRLSTDIFPATAVTPFYRGLLETKRARERFGQSELIARLWPAALRAKSLDAFGLQHLIDSTFLPAPDTRDAQRLVALDRVLERTDLRTLPLWLLGTNEREVQVGERLASRGESSPQISFLLGARALSERRDADAARHLAHAASSDPASYGLKATYALCRAKQTEEARGVAAALDASEREAPNAERFWGLLELICRLERPRSSVHD